MMPPMQVSVALALPEMDPKIPQARTPAALRPPLIWPMNISARATRGAAILPFSMMPPAIMNSGIARRTSERMPVDPVGRYPVID